MEHLSATAGGATNLIVVMMGPRRNLTTVSMLKEHSNKMYRYPRRSEPCSAFIRGAFSCSRWKLAHGPTTGQFVKNARLGGLGPKWDVFTKLFPLRSQGPMRKRTKTETLRGRRRLQGNCLLDTTRLVQRRTQRVCSNRPLNLCTFKSDKIPARRRGSGHKVAALTMKLFTTDAWWERQNPFLNGELLGIADILQVQG